MAKLTPEEKAKIKEDAKIKLAEAKREAARKKLKNPVLYNVCLLYTSDAADE